MPKRGDHAALPPGQGEWDLVFETTEAARGWEQLRRPAPGALLEAWRHLRTDPRRRDRRQRPLKGSDLGVRKIGGQVLEQWQYEVTGGGRIWYCIDEQQVTVRLTWAGADHPTRTNPSA
ncbi:MAG: hypothetical protein ACRD0K_25700 [Egibacteraceae bacterium]